MDWLNTIPGPVWGFFGVAITGAAMVLRDWLTGRNRNKIDAGQLALEIAEDLRARVEKLETERNAYRSHANILHEWGGWVETPERPRPMWPDHLPR